MTPESKELLDKMNRLIAGASKRDYLIVERYLSLASRQLRKDNTDLGSVMGASLATKNNYEAKFGTFIARAEPIRLGVDT